MGTPPDAVLRLVDRFSQDYKVFLSSDYKEEQLRAEFGQRTCRLRFLNPSFLNPFFTALGWEMDNALDTILTRNGEDTSFPHASHPFDDGGKARRAGWWVSLC